MIAAPGILALLGRRGRPGLYLPAAVVLVPLSFISFALVTLPLLIPAWLLARSAARALSRRDLIRAVAATVAVLAVLFAALLALFVHQDPREWTEGSTTWGTSDVTTPIEALASTALTAAAIGLGYAIAPHHHD